jgi:hypothetical protein
MVADQEAADITVIGTRARARPTELLVLLLAALARDPACGHRIAVGLTEVPAARGAHAAARRRRHLAARARHLLRRLTAKELSDPSHSVIRLIADRGDAAHAPSLLGDAT